MITPQTKDLRSNDAPAFWFDFGFPVYPVDVLSGQPVTRFSSADEPLSRSAVLANFISHPSSLIEAIMPKGVVALRVPSCGAKVLWDYLKARSAVPHLIVSMMDGGTQVFYSLEPGADLKQLRTGMPPEIQLLAHGDRIELPSGDFFDPAKYHAADITGLDPLPTGDVIHEATAVTSPLVSTANPVVPDNPLARYSMRGNAAEMELLALETTPLLGNVVLSGQSTIVYAPPNSGKTLVVLRLVMDAVEAGRVEGGNVYYLNADDSSSGAAHKLRLLDDVNVHTLIPGRKGFTTEHFVKLLIDMAATGKCRGVLIIVDTLKKVADLMNKANSAAFGEAVRACVMGGATFVGLAHTRKNPNAAGKFVHGGTSDMIEDADAACLMIPAENSAGSGEKIVTFEFSKRRGDNVDEAYAYATERGISYDELIASVRLVDPDKMERIVAEADAQSDGPIIAAVLQCLAEGIAAKMLLADAVAKSSGVSKRRAIQVIERYQGADPGIHRWSYSVQARGAKVYRALAI